MTAVVDRCALQDLALDYALALDERDADAFVVLFTDDAVMETFEPDEQIPFLRFAGRAELRTLLDRFDQWGPTMHVMTNHRLRINGDVAAGVVYAVAYHTTQREGHPYTVAMSLRYDDRYVRGADGWLFARRTISRLWNEVRPLLDERAPY